jgi:hypothetical protein
VRLPLSTLSAVLHILDGIEFVMTEVRSASTWIYYTPSVR